MTKRILAYVLVLAMLASAVLTLTGCGDSKKNNKKKEESRI